MGLVCASSLNEKLLMPRVGVSLIRQSTGLNAPVPWNRSNETEKKSSVKKSPPLAVFMLSVQVLPASNSFRTSTALASIG